VTFHSLTHHYLVQRTLYDDCSSQHRRKLHLYLVLPVRRRGIQLQDTRHSRERCGSLQPKPPTSSHSTSFFLVESFFKTQFADAVPLMPTLTQDFFNNPTGNLATIRCFPWAVDVRTHINAFPMQSLSDGSIYRASLHSWETLVMVLCLSLDKE